MIRRQVLPPSVARASAWLGIFGMFGCQVYDPDLLDQVSAHDAVAEAPRARSARAPGPDADRAPVFAAEGCGNGVVEEDEACDIAIARGVPGACPDGCSGGQGCHLYELEGSDCNAHCVPRERIYVQSDDSCCPLGLDYYQDNDCAPRCGNAELEPGEMCDPAATCVTRAACRRTDVCETASYVGSADSCDARCEIAPIQSCIDGDGCCPPGCDRVRDNDCAGECPVGAACSPPALRAEFDCNTAHEGSACRACDCARCAAEINACLSADSAQEAVQCGAAIDCSEEHGCTTDVCYCGSASLESCGNTPAGACVPEWQAAASSTSTSNVFYLAGSPEFTLGRAAAVITCRERLCAAECGLD